MSGTRRKGLAFLLLVVLLAVAPTALFWFRWMMPSGAFPPDMDSPVAADRRADPELMAQLERVLVEGRRESGAPSLSAAVSLDGELIWAGASGFSDIDAAERSNPAVLYRLGSASKAVTGALLGRLMDAGSIRLDARVADYAPELPEDLQAITVRQLASHTGGLRHYSRVLTWLPGRHESITPRHFDSVEEGLDLFVGDEVLFSPGSDFNYSTFGYSLLAHVMERATGSDFESLLDRYLNQPLGTDVRLDDLTVDMRDRATAYTTAKGRWGPAYPADPSYKWAGGGLVATPSDLVRIGQALTDENFLSARSRSHLWSPVPVPGSDTNPENYGLGWRIDTSTRTLGEDRPVRMIHHGGTQMGGVAFWAIYPELGLSVAVVANTGERAVRGDVQDASYALARTVVGAFTETPDGA